jgi:hypothetical protein
VPHNAEPRFESPKLAAAAGGSQVKRFVATEVRGDRAVILVEEDDDGGGGLFSLVLCEQSAGGWAVMSQSGGFSDEAALWVSSDPGEGGGNGVGIYCKHFGGTIGVAVIGTGDHSVDVPITDGGRSPSTGM